MLNTQSDEIRMKSRWIDVEKTVKMLSATSCPASTIKKMTDISVHSSIANKIDYKLRPATVKEVRRNKKDAYDNHGAHQNTLCPPPLQFFPRQSTKSQR